MKTTEKPVVETDVHDNELSSNLQILRIKSLVGKTLFYSTIPCGFAILAYFSIQEVWAAAAATVALGFVVLFVSFNVWTSSSSELKKMLGQNITKPILEGIFQVIDYSPESGISVDLIRSSNLIHHWDTYSGSDFLQGKYKGIDVLYSDIHLQEKIEETDEDGKTQTRYETRFKGQWLICDFHKELAAYLQIRENREHRIFKGYKKSKSDIQTENPEFNEKFQILTSDGYTAFYVLTPHFMEHIISTDTFAKAQSFFCFRDDKVHIALNSGRDSFELKGIRVNDLEEIRRDFRRELIHMTGIIDELLLNDKLFKEV